MKKLVKAVLWSIVSSCFLALTWYSIFQIPWSPAKEIASCMFILGGYITLNKAWSLFNGTTREKLLQNYLDYMYKMPVNHPVVKNWLKQPMFRRIYLVQLTHVFLVAQGIDDPDGLLSEYLISSFEKKANQWLMDRGILDCVEAE